MSKLGGWTLATVSFVIMISLLLAILHYRQGYDALSDRVAIEHAITQYAYRWDAKDASGFANLFTEDAVIERWVLGELKSRLQGRDALQDYARKSHQGRLADRQTRHHLSAIVFIELTTDSALTENMALITHQTAADPAARIAGSGTYRNTWRRTQDGWKIARRVLTTDKVVNIQSKAQ